MLTRIQKIISQAGVASRRKAEALIAEGRVTVNGKPAELGAKAGVRDEVAVDGVPVGRAPRKKTYIALHKPEGVVTTASDELGRPTVLDCLPPEKRLFPVGRLDFDTSGLIFLTDDGDWANTLTHPKHEVPKTYIATLRGEPTEAALKKFREGIKIEGRKTAPAEIEILRTKGGASAITKVRIIIREGRNRQIRKMCEAIGHPVITLKRVAIGDVRLGELQSGRWRHLLEGEVKALGS